jgi:hypothetical protein
VCERGVREQDLIDLHLCTCGFCREDHCLCMALVVMVATPAHMDICGGLGGSRVCAGGGQARKISRLESENERV